MELLLLSICLSIFSLEVASTAEPYYAITVPAQMLYPSKQKACITILKLKGELQLKMELKKEQTSVLVAEDTIRGPTYFHCYSFELPVVVGEDEVWSFDVSVHGDTLNINRTKKVLLMRGFHLTFIQTDKPNYKPGQTVNFRIISLDKNFQTKNDKYPLVELFDPNNNRIGQWLEVSPKQGFVDLSFPLANELPLGDYTISIAHTYKTWFSVSEYVPKRFSLKTELPQEVKARDKSMNLKVCGSYTYGKPVSGMFEVTVCYNKRVSYRSYSQLQGMGNCQNISAHTDDKGCLSREIDLTFFNMSTTSLFDILRITAFLTDDIYGETESASDSVGVASRPFVEFEQIPEFYQKGIPFTAKLKVVEKAQPKVNQTVYLVLGFEEEDLNLTSVTNEEGIAVFNVDTSTWDDMVSVSGKLSLEETGREYSRAFAWVHSLYSESNSYLTVNTHTSSLTCDGDHNLTVEYFINTSELDPADDKLHFFYFYTSKGTIISHGEYDSDITGQSVGSVLHGHFDLKLPVGSEYYPKYTFVVHTILNNGDIPSYTKEFTIPPCLKNKIQLKFSKNEVRPGEKVKLEVTAGSGSVCSVRSVDKGILLHKPHKTISDLRFMFQMMTWMVKLNKRGFPYAIEDFEKYPCLRNKKDPQAEIQEAEWYHGDADVYMMLKHSNIKIITNGKIRKPVMCSAQSITRRISNQPHKTVELPTSPHSQSKEEKKKPMKRMFFPETWLYDLVFVGPQGHTVLNLTAPHGITTWETDALCLGKSGFGEISDVQLTTFQPYFIDLASPYSVVQGEIFTVTAHIFSYQKPCMKVHVTLSDLKDYPILGDKRQSQCICGEQPGSFTWNVSASKPGNLNVRVSSSAQELEGDCTGPRTEGKDQIEDTIEKNIIVKPSGILEEKTQTFLLCPSGDSVRRTVTLEVPEKVVPGSEQALITVLGDLMGSAILNVGSTLKLPSGSGEQNLMNFIPISYIVKYLETTKQLKPDIKEKATTYLTKGYLRQLLFKKDDGSYSVYHGIPGSTWLTAFTVRSFSHAQDLIYIQEKHITDAVRWFSGLQMPSGCFQEVGKMFNNYLMNEADNNVTLTAYITIALLEHGQVYNNTLVENALMCLKNAIDDAKTTYTQALLAYVFTLAQYSDLRKHMLEILEKSAVKEDGKKYWRADERAHGDLEITSLVLLALLSDQTTSQRDVEEASTIVNWIIKAQGPHGGFPSTQGTAVCLQALTKYAKATFTDNLDVTVTVRSLSGFHSQFHVDEKNSLLTQRGILPDIPGEYTLTAIGTGCAYVQTYLKYHTPLAKSDAFFTLTASTEPSACTKEAKKGFDIIVEASYSGERTATNAVIIEVQLLSGFIPNKKSVKKLENQPVVRKTELSPNKLLIYLEQLTNEIVTCRFSLKPEIFVSNLQAAKVKIYDHYAPDEYALTDYNSPCSTEQEKDS
ncbi:alpha-2-macroglobulin-like protein 1 [Leptodactylus fuscus]|uniref:alpha-2-macroglobulin-like protein 1 n=1 Tax=Leptodactylus fuscus TaxID=238119 RepID=UPI003F4E5259